MKTRGYGWQSSDGVIYTSEVPDLGPGDTGRTIVFTVRHADTPEISAPEFDVPFTIAAKGGIEADANPGDNITSVYVGVPDLVVADWGVQPDPKTVQANVPIIFTFTITMTNQGTGWAWNPDNEGGFWVDIFTAPVVSYPYERDGDFFSESPPVGPGNQRTVVITHEPGFTEQELLQIKVFYAKVDNYFSPDYGLVPESDETNNLGEPFALWLYHVYLPLVRR